MFVVGKRVRVRLPFSEFYPGVYEIEAISETGAYRICGGVDFDAIYLEAVT